MALDIERLKAVQRGAKLTEDEVSQILDVPVNTLRSWRTAARKCGPEHIPSSLGRAARAMYPVSAIRAWVKTEEGQRALNRKRRPVTAAAG